MSDIKFNYRILIISQSTLAIAMGIFMPFWIIFIQKFGNGIESFGFAMGLMALAQSIASYFFGKYSDKFGRKIFLIIAGYATILIVLSYTLINSLNQLYILQILDGIISAIDLTVGQAFLADITRKSTRGKDVGKYHAIVGIIASFAVMAGGVLAGRLGLKFLFYVTAIFMFISTTVLFWIKE